jgi:beta-galactosidase
VLGAPDNRALPPNKEYAVVTRNGYCLLLIAVALLAKTMPAFADRSTFSFNQGWRFFRPEEGSPGQHDTVDDSHAAPAFNDANWETVTVPHTVRLEPYDASGGRNYQGVAWYRRHFQPLDNWKGQRLLLRFGAAMQVADVWINGKHLTTHYGGYTPFTLDITVTFGTDNVLALRLDNSDNPEVPPGKAQNKLDFTYFGGLYRDVHLDVVDPLHVSDVMLANKPAGGGIFVSFPTVAKEAATVQVQTDVQNEYTDTRTATVLQELRDADGAVVATAKVDIQIPAGADQTPKQLLQVTNPKLWHPEHPNLYTLRTTISQAGHITDTINTRVGIRTFRFDAQNGLLINGEKFVSLGANRHQDHPYVGYALSDNAQYRDARKLREAGFTSIRSHYPQDPSFVDACDELGMLLIVSNPGWQFVGNQLFARRAYQDARDMIRRDRNHPCVILWEAQLNESINTALFPTLQALVHEEFPFDPCYTAGDTIKRRASAETQSAADWDLVYGEGPHNAVWIRETGDVVDNWTDQQSRSRVARGWGETPMLVQAWSHATQFNQAFARNGHRLAGLDLWAGVDAYRGYHHQPFLGAPIDLFRLPKFDYYMFASQRPPEVHVPGIDDGPMVFIANFATYQSPTMVTVFSNCEEVRLLQNGTEVSTQKPTRNYALPHPPFTFKVGQFSDEQSTLYMTGVARPGTRVGELKAEGLIGGKVVATYTVHAPGTPTSLVLKADPAGRDLQTDGNDWIRIHAYVCDARGTTHPFADDEITFTIEGEGQIIDDPRIKANPVRAEAGIATVLVRSTPHAGAIMVRATAFGLKPAEVRLQSQPMTGTVVPGRDVPK